MSKQGSASIHLFGVPALIAYLVAISATCTQYAASRLAYHPALGEPLFAKVYAPFAWFGWQSRFYDSAPITFNIAYVIFMVGAGIGVLAYVLVVGFVNNSLKRHDDVHGTAHFASREEIEAAGLLPRSYRGFARLWRKLTGKPLTEKSKPDGVYCGGWKDDAGTLHYLRHSGPEHVAVIAPTRSGKGVGLVNPTLLTWPHSLVATDMKGELYNGTAGWRQKYAGNTIVNFNPSSMGDTCAINPLSEIRIGTPHEVSDVQNVATIIVDPSGRGIDRLGHFEKTAQQFLIGLILHVLYKVRAQEQRIAGLGDVGDAMSDPTRSADELYQEMMQNTHLNGMSHPVVARAGAQQANRPEEERGSVHSTALSFFALYDDPIVRANTSRSDFKIMDLMNAEKPITLYLGLRPEDKDRMKPLVRLVISQILRVLLRPEIEFINGREIAPHKRRLLFMLDEFPSFGKLEVVQENLAYMAGYGIKAYIIMQDLPQLWQHYGKEESTLSNCHVRIAYAPNKPETAEYLSRLTGKMTIIKESTTVSGKRFGMLMQQASTSYQEQSRELMTPDEVLRMAGPTKDASGKITAPGDMLISVAGFAPIKGTQSLYFMDPVLLARWGLPFVKQKSNWSGDAHAGQVAHAEGFVVQ